MIRNPALDGVRGIAIGAVVLHHLSSSRFPGGFLGVDLFFVLSGFLITRLLLNEIDANGRIDFKHFYWRRFLRLAPALIVTVAAYVIFAAEFLPDFAFHLTDAGLGLSYFSNWTRAFEWGNPPRPVALGHTWSLSIEEQFYFLWPITLLALCRVRRLALPITVAIIVAVVLWRAYLMYHGANIWRLSNGTDTHIDIVLTGAALAFIARGRHAAGAIAHQMSALSIVTLAALGWYIATLELATPRLFAFDYTFIAVAFAILIWTADDETPTLLRKALEFAPLVYIGRISYGLYLFHWPIINYAQMFLSGWPLLLTQILLPVMIAAMSFRFVEQPIMEGRVKHARLV